MPNPFADRSPVRRQRLRALVKSPSDYNEHYLDVNPAPDVETDFHARARAAMGLTA
jgi:hypothetical protein